MDIETIALAVSAEWQMGFGGIEWDFALEVAKRAGAAEREACAVLCERSDRYRGEYFAAKIRERFNGEVRGVSRLAGEASASTVVLGTGEYGSE